MARLKISCEFNATREHITHLKQSGDPDVPGVNGKAKVVVQISDAYQKLLQDHELLECLRSATQRIEEATGGEGSPL